MAKAPAKTAKKPKAFLGEFARENPAVAGLLRLILSSLLLGMSQDDRRALAQAQAELDSDGDGVPDAQDAFPNDASRS